MVVNVDNMIPNGRGGGHTLTDMEYGIQKCGRICRQTVETMVLLIINNQVKRVLISIVTSDERFLITFRF